MANPDQNYLDSGYPSAKNTSLANVLPIVLIDPTTNDFQKPLPDSLKEAISKGNYMVAIVINPNNQEPSTL